MDTDYGGFKTTTFDSVINWSRKFSLFQYPFNLNYFDKAWRSTRQKENHF